MGIITHIIESVQIIHKIWTVKIFVVSMLSHRQWHYISLQLIFQVIVYIKKQNIPLLSKNQVQCIIIICYFVKHLNSNAKRRRNCDAFDLKFNYNCCAFLGFAFKPDSTAVIGYGVFDDGKSETCAAGFF